MKKYTLYLLAPIKFLDLQNDLQNVGMHQGESSFLEISKSTSDIKVFHELIENTNIEQQPDFILIFDVSETAISQAQAHTNMLKAIKSSRLNLQSKIVVILPLEKESDLWFINELIKLNVQDFYFVDDFYIDDLRSWLIEENKTLADNQKYLSAQIANNQSTTREVVTEYKTEVVIKEVFVKPKDYQKTIVIVGDRQKGVTTVCDLLEAVYSDYSVKTKKIRELAKGDNQIDHGVVILEIDMDYFACHREEIQYMPCEIIIVHDLNMLHIMCCTYLIIELLRMKIPADRVKILFNKNMNIGIDYKGIIDFIVAGGYKEAEQQEIQEYLKKVKPLWLSFSLDLMQENLKSIYTRQKIKIPESVMDEIAVIANEIYPFKNTEQERRKVNNISAISNLFRRKK